MDFRQTIFREYKSEFGKKINRLKSYHTDSVIQKQRMEDHKGSYYSYLKYIYIYIINIADNKFWDWCKTLLEKKSYIDFFITKLIFLKNSINDKWFFMKFNLNFKPLFERYLLNVRWPWTNWVERVCFLLL